jgi:hypothetical protein
VQRNVKSDYYQADGLAFTNTGTQNGNSDNSGVRNRDHVTRFECGQTGHYANRSSYRNKNEEPTKNDQEGINLCTHGVEEIFDGGFHFTKSVDLTYLADGFF